MLLEITYADTLAINSQEGSITENTTNYVR
jgi:hypothetical protein